MDRMQFPFIEHKLNRLTLLPTAFYDFLSYGGDFYPTPQQTMLKLFDWLEIWYT